VSTGVRIPYGTPSFYRRLDCLANQGVLVCSERVATRAGTIQRVGTSQPADSQAPALSGHPITVIRMPVEQCTAVSRGQLSHRLDWSTRVSMSASVRTLPCRRPCEEPAYGDVARDCLYEAPCACSSGRLSPCRLDRQWFDPPEAVQRFSPAEVTILGVTCGASQSLADSRAILPIPPSLGKNVPKSLTQLTAQIEKLQKEAQAIKAKELNDVISRIKEAIGHYGLTAADLGLTRSRAGKSAAAGKAAAKKGKTGKARKTGAIMFRSVDGQRGWTGRGRAPNWFKQAIAEGASKESLLVG
jgi:DNA-binding protein H-NS